MDLVVFENNKPWVIDEFREGHFARLLPILAPRVPLRAA